MTTTTPTAQSPAAANATTNATASTAQAAGNATQQLLGNFNTFLTLLTTQLKNQNPLDPLDTNQFTQQLVEFASVEQQVNMNTNMQTLISLQQTNEATSALQFLGTTVTVSGKTSTLSNATGAPAAWTISSPSPATANVTISASNGQTVFSGPVSLSAGNQTFTWNGKGNNAGDQRHECQRPSRRGLNPSAGHRQRHQSQPEPAAAHGRRPELFHQPDPIHQPLAAPATARQGGTGAAPPVAAGPNAEKRYQMTVSLRQILSGAA